MYSVPMPRLSEPIYIQICLIVVTGTLANLYIVQLLGDSGVNVLWYAAGRQANPISCLKIAQLWSLYCIQLCCTCMNFNLPLAESF